ncbi:MAG: hypothetical protein O2812_01960, partial [Chloroflexi bacterium]|nr:hypothetical protein [Chloroflexota bacterium]
AARSRTDFDKERALLATEFGVAVEFNYETPGEKEVSASSTEEMKQLKGFLANPKLLKILKFFLPGVNLDPEVDVSFHGWQLAFSLFLAVTLVITIPILFSVLMLRRLFKPLRFLAGRFDSKVRIFPGKQRMTWSVATWAPRVILGVVYYEIVKVPLWLLEFVGALSQFGIYISSVNISAFLRSARWARAAASFGAFLFISGLALQFAGSFRE